MCPGSDEGPTVPPYLKAMEAVQAMMPDWPAWSVKYLVGTGAFAFAALGLEMALRPKRKAPSSASGETKEEKASSTAVPAGFRAFQARYLAVYLVVMLADWLQGTNMYTLYTGYGVDTASLFLGGFLSSAVFGTVLGLFVDDYGRKLACMVFCFLEVVINLLEHVPDFRLLLVGRVLGGLSTSLLFSSFESWMVSEHRKQGYPEELLSSTFALASTGNGIMAIIAGLIAQVACDRLGDIGPFQAAIALTVLAWVLIATLWDENKAEHEGEAATRSGWATLKSSVSESSALIWTRPAIAGIGMAMALFEGAMYTFVFNWVPRLMQLAPTALPTGIVFSSFMVCVSAGGILYSLAQEHKVTAEATSHGIFIMSALAMAVCAVSNQLDPTMIAFCAFETFVGVSFACLGVLRSRYIPESHMAGILACVRLPLNLLVVIGTKLSDVWPADRVFWVCTAWHLGASAVLALGLSVDAKRKAKTK